MNQEAQEYFRRFDELMAELNASNLRRCWLDGLQARGKAVEAELESLLAEIRADQKAVELGQLLRIHDNRFSALESH